MSISTFDLNRHHFLGTAVTAGTSAAFGATLAVNEAIADARGNTKRLCRPMRPRFLKRT
jgi:hypothetical protein